MEQWFRQRNLKANRADVKWALQQCKNCPATQTRFRHNYRGVVGYKLHLNKIVQIDYIGPLSNFKNKYACTMVDMCTGLGLTRASPHPDQLGTILTILTWCTMLGTPEVIQSDQGTHFTGKDIQKIAKQVDIQWISIRHILQQLQDPLKDLMIC